MADQSDVQNVLVGLISGILFPNGTSQASITGGCIQIFPGWPSPQQLANLAQTSLVSVLTLPGERNTTRYDEKWRTAKVNAPTLTLFASGQTVLVGGTIPPADNPHHVVIFANGKPYPYGVQPTDTLQTIAAALATLISQDVVGTVSADATVVLPAGTVLGPARVGVTGTSVKLLKQQEKQFQISIWTATPAIRSAIGKALDAALAKLTFINLPDCTSGRFRYLRSPEFDNWQKQGVYRRDLIYTVDFSTTDVRVDYQVTQMQIDISADIGGVPPAQPVTTVNL